MREAGVKVFISKPFTASLVIDALYDLGAEALT